MQNDTHVAILLACFNGEDFLADQLDSFLAQTHTNWSLWISDDGSTDRTAEIIFDFQQKHTERDINFVNGPCQGHCRNFLSLVFNKDIKADLFAFADQDDVWFPEKLKMGIETFAKSPKDRACLYGGQTIVTDRDLRPKHQSKNTVYLPGFKNALVQNFACGNTMMFNQAVRDLVVKAGSECRPNQHDHWLYQLTSGSGGLVFQDPRPVLYYRRHGKNISDTNADLTGRLSLIRKNLGGQFQIACTQNVAALKLCTHLLTANNLTVLSDFVVMRNSTGITALKMLRISGLYRKNWKGNVFLGIAAFIGRI